MFVLFNKNKEFIGYSPEFPENSEILKIEIPEEKSDISLWKWEGTYDNGRMAPINIGYSIEEIELEREMFEYIEKKFPIKTQLINIIKQLRKITKSNSNLEEYEFVDMADYILNAIEKRDRRINYYRNHYNLISKDETEKLNKKLGI